MVFTSQQGAVQLQRSVPAAACASVHSLCMGGGKRGLLPAVNFSSTASLMDMSVYSYHSVVTFKMNTSWPLIMLHEHGG